MKQLSSAFVVVDETRDVTICEYLTADRQHIHRFAIVWDEDHDERIVEVIEQMIADDFMFFVAALSESQGHVIFCMLQGAEARDSFTISNDYWTTENHDLGDPSRLTDVARAFRCGSRAFKIGGVK
jgi:hypothetical protein